MNILVANDDGIDSIGLLKLVKELSTIGNVYVCAPNSQRSAYSHHFTLSGKMKFEEKHVDGAVKAYSLGGTPVDCVHCGKQFIFKDINFDLVVSGINTSWNVSSDAIYSGTVAAAREGLIMGIPSIAMSLAAKTYTEEYEYAAKVAKEVALLYLEDENKKEYFLNVNVPNMKESDIKGIRVCDGTGYVKYDEGYYFDEDEDGKYVVLGKGRVTLNIDEHNRYIDINALEDGYISLTPFTLDQTSRGYMQYCKDRYSK